MPSYPSVTEPLSPTAPVTASLVAPIPVPTHGPGGHFSVLAKTHIPNVSPVTVLSLIRDTNTWPKWNSFCPACSISPKKPKGSGDGDGGAEGESEHEMRSGKEGWLEQGSVASIDVFMNGDGLVKGRRKSREQGVIVTAIHALDDGRVGYRIAWKSTGWSHWQMHSERVMEFVDDGNGGTEYACWETFGGILASVIKATYGGTLVERFGDYARDMRGWFEKNGGQGVKANGFTNGAPVANGSA